MTLRPKNVGGLEGQRLPMAYLLPIVAPTENSALPLKGHRRFDDQQTREVPWEASVTTDQKFSQATSTIPIVMSAGDL